MIYKAILLSGVLNYMKINNLSIKILLLIKVWKTYINITIHITKNMVLFGSCFLSHRGKKITFTLYCMEISILIGLISCTSPFVFKTKHNASFLLFPKDSEQRFKGLSKVFKIESFKV